jgi:subtilase family serine protease
VKNFTFLHRLLLLVGGLLALQPARLHAQSYLLPVSGSASYTTCAGTLYDDGGPTDPHEVNASGSVTLRPGTAGAKLKLEFTTLEVDSVNTGLYIYDGPDTKSPLIGRFYAGQPTVYATGSTGALTVAISAYGYPLRGFAATISCYTGTPPVPDVAVSSLVLTPTVTPAGDDIAARARIGNLTGRLATFRMRYLLSTDTKVDAADQELGQGDADLTAGTFYTFWKNMTVPTGTAPGKYYVLLVTELLSATEANTTNNLAYAPLTIAPLTNIPDLAITTLGFNGPLVLGPGSFLDTNARQQNFGNMPAQSAAIGYYLSTDATLSPDDQFLGQAMGDALPAGKSSIDYKTVALPSTVAPGSYYLLCVADYFDQVIEADEQNNTYAKPLTIAPPSVDVDFGKRLSAAPSQVGPGGTLTVTYYLQNEGNSALDSAAVGYYLSADRNLSADDVLLDRSVVGPLLPGLYVSNYVTRTMPVPATVPLGKRYLLIVADYRHEITESNEANNLATLQLDVVMPQVDLTFTTVSNGSVYSPAVGSFFTTRCTLLNQGSTVAYPATIGYYYSTDNRLSADDVLLGQDALQPLASAGSQEIYHNLTLPPTAVVGPAYMLYVADYQGQVTETDEANNVKALTIQVGLAGVDLVLDNNFDVLPTRAAAGTDVKLSYYFDNIGTTPISGPLVWFYLSTDNAWSSDDIFIGSDQAYTLYPKYASSRTTLGSIPPSTPAGKYFIVGVVDPLSDFAETNETNNVRATPLEVTAARPDLTVLANPFPYLAPRLALAGGQVTTESYINNFGASASAASAVGYYLSTDPVLSANDILLGSTPTEALRAGGSTLVAGSFTVPAATPTGRYYVLFVADHRQLTDDLNRNNNIGTNTLSVTGSALATREQLGGYELAVWPVPAAGATPLRVQLSGASARAEASLALYNSLGQVARTQTLALAPGRSNQTELPTAGLAAGVYVLRITGPSLNATRRVVIE